jgi:hypothetical protein
MRRASQTNDSRQYGITEACECASPYGKEAKPIDSDRQFFSLVFRMIARTATAALATAIVLALTPVIARKIAASSSSCRTTQTGNCAAKI